LYDDLTARENLAFAAEMLGIPATVCDAQLDFAGLHDVAGERVRGFSAGMQRRLTLARLRMARPHVLLLDEPYSNLDAAGVSLMNATIAESIGGGGAALIALHETAPAEPVLTRIMTLANGRVTEGAAAGAASRLSAGANR
jgi:heme exporter protein A